MGSTIQLMGNIEFPHEVELCKQRGANGIGLYRTEFLYLGRDDDPSEETHYEAYSAVVHDMGNLPVVMRTLDLGADKMRSLPDPEDERNPFLGSAAFASLCAIAICSGPNCGRFCGQAPGARFASCFL